MGGGLEAVRTRTLPATNCVLELGYLHRKASGWADRVAVFHACEGDFIQESLNKRPHG